MSPGVVLWSQSLSGVMSTVLEKSQSKLVSKLTMSREAAKDIWFKMVCNTLLKEYTKILKQQPGYIQSKEKNIIGKMSGRLKNKPTMKQIKLDNLRFIFKMVQHKIKTESEEKNPQQFLEQFSQILFNTCQV
jgi:hypothetical protein